ncbi:putative transcription initiation factor IIE subunit alpha, TFIIEalpha/SarR/Rpc3 HTH [Helianthus annuus]|nr:putative transcription initiation factor IIE subunit alpha, TFIIEalpha/SarR/Rpc3 HTH [Helianthus annuus]
MHERIFILRQWVREEDLAKDLKLHLKQLRRTLRFFEEEKLVTRDHRKETAKGAKAYSAAVAATADNLPGRDGEEKIKLHTHSYCCLDYAQVSLSLSHTHSQAHSLLPLTLQELSFLRYKKCI